MAAISLNSPAVVQGSEDGSDPGALSSSPVTPQTPRLLRKDSFQSGSLSSGVRTKDLYVLVGAPASLCDVCGNML